MADDVELVAAARAGDEGAFRTLIERNAVWAYGLAVAVAGSVEADDVLQEATYRAWRDLPRLRQPTMWNAWFRRIVTHTAVDLARKHRRTIVYFPPASPDGADLARDFAQADAVESALAFLAPDERALLALRYGQDLELPVVADLMGIRLGTAKSRLHRTLQKLRKLLESDRWT